MGRSVDEDMAIKIVAYECGEFTGLAKEIEKQIKALPSAQSERKTGKWETVEGWDWDAMYRCSECGTEFALIDGTPEENDYHFCPNCGAYMKE